MPSLAELAARHAELLSRCERERKMAGDRAADIAEVIAGADRGIARLRRLPLKAAAVVVVAAGTWLLTRRRAQALGRLGLVAGLIGSGLRLRAPAGRWLRRLAPPGNGA